MAGSKIGHKFFAPRSALTYISHQKKYHGRTRISHDSPGWGNYKDELPEEDQNQNENQLPETQKQNNNSFGKKE